MNAQHKARLAQLQAVRIARARELLAYAQTVGIEIGWEGEYTTFTPHTGTPQKFIEEATLLSREIKALREGRIK